MASFIDSNILVYAVTPDTRGHRAGEVMSDPFITSVQSINEVTHVLRRKFKRDWSDVDRAIALIKAACERIDPILVDTQQNARRIAQRYRLAIYDAQILASALGAACDTLYSEDKHHGLVIDDRLAIVNPFA